MKSKSSERFSDNFMGLVINPPGTVPYDKLLDRINAIQSQDVREQALAALQAQEPTTLQKLLDKAGV